MLLGTKDHGYTRHKKSKTEKELVAQGGSAELGLDLKESLEVQWKVRVPSFRSIGQTSVTNGRPGFQWYEAPSFRSKIRALFS